MSIEVLRHDGLVAIRRSVLLEISRPHLRRHYLQTAAAWLSVRVHMRSTHGYVAKPTVLPPADRLSLPGRLTGGRLRWHESNQACLSSGIRIDTKSVVIDPRHMYSRRHSQDV